MRVGAAVWWLSVAAGVLIAGCSGEPVEERPGQPVTTRQRIFKTMIREFEPMGVMLREGSWEQGRFLGHWARFQEVVDAPWRLFDRDTCGPPAKVTPAACSDWEGLQRQAERFRETVEGLATALAESGVSEGRTPSREGLQRVKAAYDAVYEECRECHRVYRRR
ncbi:MAG: cytochrome c [Hydrogenophilus sp.]|nr:cytochrome c [Hydrogenophilus sp.]